MTLTAYVDESARARRGQPGGYCLAAALVVPGAGDRVRHALRDLLDRRQPRLHWRAESPERRRRIVATLAELELPGLVVAASIPGPGGQERARGECMRAMVWELTAGRPDGPVRHLVLESRGPGLDRQDDQRLRGLRQSKELPRETRYEFERPGNEPLLWAPDAIAGAFMAALSDRDDQYAGRLRPLVRLVQL